MTHQGVGRLAGLILRELPEQQHGKAISQGLRGEEGLRGISGIAVLVLPTLRPSDILRCGSI